MTTIREDKLYMLYITFQNGLNALHLAAKDGHITVVEELLKRGAIVDAATKKGKKTKLFNIQTLQKCLTHRLMPAERNFVVCK